MRTVNNGIAIAGATDGRVGVYPHASLRRDAEANRAYRSFTALYGVTFRYTFSSPRRPRATGKGLGPA